MFDGQVIGEANTDQDMKLNITREKRLTNMRQQNKEEKMRIPPARKLALEEALEYIEQNELVEVGS